MGVSAYATFGIGVLFDVTDLAPKRFTPSCVHHERIGNKFCPQCGTKVEDVEIEDDLHHYVLSSLEEYKDTSFQENKFYAISCEPMGVEYRDDTYMLGWIIKLGGDRSKRIKIEHSMPFEEHVLVEIRKALAYALEKNGIFPAPIIDKLLSNGTFGTHMGLRYS